MNRRHGPFDLDEKSRGRFIQTQSRPADLPDFAEFVVAKGWIEAQLFEAGREGTLRLTISIGVATCPTHGSAREPLLDAADKAMYRAKSDGRNRVCSADDLGPAARP